MTPEQVEARRRALEDEELGLAGTILIEPLTALAGGIMGGLTVAVLAWRLAWRRSATTATARTIRRARR